MEADYGKENNMLDSHCVDADKRRLGAFRLRR
jgi:hypothetical protein